MNTTTDNVPWPAMWKYKKPSNRPAVREVEWAIARELHEQDLWADRFEALRQLNLPDNAIEKVEAMGVETLFDRMAKEGAEYPSTDDDRKRWLETVGEEWHWSDSPNHQKIQQVKDEELQFMLKWLLEFGQQKEVIKSIVLLPAILGVDPDDVETHAVFRMWQAVIVTKALNKEMPRYLEEG